MTFADTNKYHGLVMHKSTRFILHYHPKNFYKCCNGVGSDSGNWFDKLIYHITPNTVWGLNIKIVADIHDVEYTYPDNFKTIEDAIEWKSETDERFKSNLDVHIKRQNSFKWLERLRLRRSKSYKFLLKHCGEKAFMKNKTIG